MLPTLRDDLSLTRRLGSMIFGAKLAAPAATFYVVLLPWPVSTRRSYWRFPNPRHAKGRGTIPRPFCVFIN
jgi:hypothetical protein